MTATPDTQYVWDQLGQTLRGYFARRLADPHTADDLTQETFLRIHRGLGSLADAERLGPWVFRIARNVLTDHLRRRKPDATLDETRDVVEDSAQADTKQQIGACLHSMLPRLPEEYRRAVEAVEIEGQTQSAYAESAGLSLSGAKSRVQRGRQKLKDEMLACCQFELDRLGKPVAFAPDHHCRGHCGCE